MGGEQGISEGAARWSMAAGCPCHPQEAGLAALPGTHPESPAMSTAAWTTSSAGDAPLHGPPAPAVSNGRIPVQPAAGRQEGTLLLIADAQCN